MQSTREIQRLFAGMLILFGLVGGIAGYWAIVGPETILERDDNPRLVERRAGILRGEIFDRNGTVLVTSVQADDGFVYRQYHYPSMYSTLGYYSLRYGEGGAESAFNEILNGDSRSRGLGDFLNEGLLHLPREGTDIRLTLDLEVQNRVAA